MTPIAGLFLAIIAGWIVREPRRAAATVILSYLAVAVAQTWAIGNGYGISPPDTVTLLSGEISCYVVQLAFLITTAAIAASLAVVRGGPGQAAFPSAPGTARPSRRPSAQQATSCSSRPGSPAPRPCVSTPRRWHPRPRAWPASGSASWVSWSRRGRRHGGQAAANQSAATR
jgi:hypothetical protein